ncbi:MAG: hypothetical protein O7D95_01525, partial [Betaproteobacteria bacterium]|nr:hypothetical protein [Betaproteobacteria bacterium]
MFVESAPRRMDFPFFPHILLSKKNDPPSRHMTGADRYHACLALQLGKDWNNRTGYAVDVAITRISPGH